MGAVGAAEGEETEQRGGCRRESCDRKCIIHSREDGGCDIDIDPGHWEMKAAGGRSALDRLWFKRSFHPDCACGEMTVYDYLQVVNLGYGGDCPEGRREAECHWLIVVSHFALCCLCLRRAPEVRWPSPPPIHFGGRLIDRLLGAMSVRTPGAQELRLFPGSKVLCIEQKKRYCLRQICFQSAIHGFRQAG